MTNNISQSTKPQRNENFEILRVVAMSMIVVWHFYFHVTWNTESLSNGVSICNYLLSQYIIIICSSCVNLFVLISGFFMIDKAFNWERIIRLWIQVAFYSFGISLVFYLIEPGSHTMNNVLRGLPISHRPYWFFQKYFGLVFLAPFLSKAVTALSQAQYKRFLLALILICCTISCYIPFGDLMGANKGFELIWFIALFFFGGYIRRFPCNYSRKQLLLSLLGVSTIAFVFIIAKGLLRHSLILEFPGYNGFGFFIAVPIFILFQQASFRHTYFTKLLTSLAPLTFGVYLVSEHPIINNKLWRQWFDWASLMESVWLIPVMILSVVLIFLVSAGIDRCRAALFGLLRISAITAWCGNKLEEFFKRKLG